MSSSGKRIGGAGRQISVVIPAYQEGTRLPVFLEQLTEAALLQSGPAVEFIVSDDGSDVRSANLEEAAVLRAQAAMAAAGAPHRFRFRRHEKNQGKGSAVRAGWADASGESSWLAFLDADGSVSAQEFFRVAKELDVLEAEVVAASRVKMAGRRVERRLFRHLQGRVFATLIEQFFALGFYDTQCGLKIFRSDWLRPVLPLLEEQGFMIDVEVLSVLRRRGARLVEIPVDWIDAPDSRVRFGIDALKMFMAMSRVRTRVEALQLEPQMPSTGRGTLTVVSAGSR